MTHVDFARAYWLGLGALACAGALVLMARAARLRGRAARLLAGVHGAVSVSRWRRRAKVALVLLGTACVFLALARPRWGFRWETEHQSGADLMFAVDTSKSMRARDLLPDRLTRAKLAVADLLRQFPGARAGLIAFAGSAFVQAPMTLDHAMFGEALEALDTSVIARGGTNISAAIRAAVDAMASEPAHRKVLVILSDGENLEGDALVAASQAARAGLVIYTVGVGSPAGAPVPGEEGQGGVMRDAAGQPVRSRLDEPMLRQLAAVTGGAYAPLGPSGRGLEALYQQHLSHLPRRTVDERTRKVWTERFALPLGVGLACLLLDLLLGDRRPGRRGSRRAAAVVAAIVMVAAGRGASAAPGEPSGGAMSGGAPTATYNDGTAAYRQRDFAGAEARFKQATRTTNLGLQQDAYYDLGNARYRVGQEALAKGNDRPAAIRAWKDALAAYDGALALQPKDGDARFNRDLVARRLAALEQQEQQERQQNQQEREPQRSGQQNQPQSGGQNRSQSGQSGGAKSNAQNGQSNGQSDERGKQQDDRQASAGSGNQGSAKGTQNNGEPDQSAGGATGNGQQASRRGTPGQQAGPQKGEAGGDANRGEPDDAREGGGQPHEADLAPRRGDASRSGAPSQAVPTGQAPLASSPTSAGAPPTPTPHGPGAITAGADAKPGAPQTAAAAGARREPGGLSRSEAVQLLDSVEGELRRLPAAGNDHAQAGAQDAPEKDW